MQTLGLGLKTMDYKHILYEVKRPHVAWITLNRPDVNNATSGDTFLELADAFRTADDDGKIGVVVLTGAGDSHFNEGGQVKQHLEKNMALTGPILENFWNVQQP